jgi:hypothetical protein
VIQVQCSAVLCGAVLCGAVLRGAVLCGVVQCEGCPRPTSALRRSALARMMESRSNPEARGIRCFHLGLQGSLVHAFKVLRYR